MNAIEQLKVLQKTLDDFHAEIGKPRRGTIKYKNTNGVLVELMGEINFILQKNFKICVNVSAGGFSRRMAPNSYNWTKMTHDSFYLWLTDDVEIIFE